MLTPCAERSRFERLALEYDSDDIGDLDDGEEEVCGVSGLEQFSGLMDEFLSEHATQDHAHEGGQCYHAAAEVLSHKLAGCDDKDDAAVAIAKVRGCPFCMIVTHCLQKRCLTKEK